MNLRDSPKWQRSRRQQRFWTRPRPWPTRSGRCALSERTRRAAWLTGARRPRPRNCAREGTPPLRTATEIAGAAFQLQQRVPCALPNMRDVLALDRSLSQIRETWLIDATKSVCFVEFFYVYTPMPWQMQAPMSHSNEARS